MLMNGYTDEQTLTGVIEVIQDRKRDELLSKRAFMEKELIDSAFKLDKLDINSSILVIDAIEVLPHLYLKGATDVTYIQYGDTRDEHKVVGKLGYTYINIQQKGTREVKVKQSFR